MNLFTEEIVLAFVYRTRHPDMTSKTQVTIILLMVRVASQKRKSSELSLFYNVSN
jgi:hypothetical protein